MLKKRRDAWYTLRCCHTSPGSQTKKFDPPVTNTQSTRTSNMTTRSSSEAGASPSKRQSKQQRVWNVVASEFSELTANPIRKIVDNIKKPENSDKPLIPLSLGMIPIARKVKHSF